jgi:hypothetical protein
LDENQQTKLINDNSDILEEAAASVDFLSFSVPIQRAFDAKKSTLQDTPNSQEYARYSLSWILMTSQPAEKNHAPIVPLRGANSGVNVPGLPPRSLTAIPMPDLELAQVQYLHLACVLA